MSSRQTVTASSLGSYFGVGFNSPLEQLDFDLGFIEQVFDEEAEDRMMIGTMLEDGALNYFEKKLSISITDRNTQVLDGFGGMLRLKMDGFTILNGEETVVENKMSNSEYKVFTKDMGYIIQCNAYMAVKGVNQALLCGFYKGKPIYRILFRDHDLIVDIEEMVHAVYGILNGILGVEDFPWHIVQKYSSTEPQTVLNEFSEDDSALVEEYMELKSLVKEMTERIDTINNFIKLKYDNMKFKGDRFSLSVSTSHRQGFLDDTLLQMELPDLDLDKYRKPPSEAKMVRITKR